MARATNKGLGRGLSALLGEEADRQSTSLSVPLSQVEPNAAQPRKHFEESALADLAQSVQEHGILQPLTVRKMASGYYQIIAGERRWRAARIAGLSEVPVLVVEADDRKAMELAMIENLQREDLTPMEEAEGYRSLMDAYQLTQEEAAERVGKSRSAVANSLRLLSLSQPLQELLEAGKLTVGHARALLPLSPELQKKTAVAVIADDLNVRQTEALVKKLTASDKPAKPTTVTVNYAEEAQRQLSETLGRGCRIVNGRKKGRIELEYYGLDDLNLLLDALNTLRTKQGEAL